MNMFSKEWILKKAKEEYGIDVAAGVPALDARGDRPNLKVNRGDEEPLEQYVFSWLIQLMRREKRLSIECLAREARIDLEELVAIEMDVRHQPKPRTVHQLAKFFRLPEKHLFELSNLTTVHSDDLKKAAVRFAANAKNVMELNKEEKQALNEFVKFLGSR